MVEGEFDSPLHVVSHLATAGEGPSSSSSSITVHPLVFSVRVETGISRRFSVVDVFSGGPVCLFRGTSARYSLVPQFLLAAKSEIDRCRECGDENHGTDEEPGCTDAPGYYSEREVFDGEFGRSWARARAVRTAAHPNTSVASGNVLVAAVELANTRVVFVREVVRIRYRAVSYIVLDEKRRLPILGGVSLEREELRRVAICTSAQKAHNAGTSSGEFNVGTRVVQVVCVVIGEIDCDVMDVSDVGIRVKFGCRVHKERTVGVTRYDAVVLDEV